MVCVHGIHRFKTNNLSTVEKKNAVFRVIIELTENLVRVRRTNIDTLLSKQFFAHFGVCCFVLRPVLKPTYAITTENRQELYEMLIFAKDYTSQAL